MIENKILISPLEAKEILGVGRNEIYTLCNQKDFPSFKIKSKFYINREGLREWADKKCGLNK